jgi:hypothetical protein
VDVVDPMNPFGIRLDFGQAEIHHDGLLAASHDHARQLRIRAAVDLLVRDERRDVDEVPRSRLGDELAPPRAVVIAAARLMPAVCGVFGSSSSARTTRTP